MSVGVRVRLLGTFIDITRVSFRILASSHPHHLVGGADLYLTLFLSGALGGGGWPCAYLVLFDTLIILLPILPRLPRRIYRAVRFFGEWKMDKPYRFQFIYHSLVSSSLTPLTTHTPPRPTIHMSLPPSPPNAMFTAKLRPPPIRIVPSVSPTR